MHDDRLRNAGVEQSEILASAREKRGLENLGEIEHAVMEAGGHIRVIPKKKR
ncbi:MAG TPA: hypothetical protein VMS56_12575 [Thermoanaerobaculia bacterium]|nr:hypothetical protein [Thermoanaerobaculia bacterium]